MMQPPAPVPEAARQHLRAAMALHEDGDIEGALAAARAALDIAPRFADALSYLGSTLVARAGRYAEGLATLEQAVAAAADDAAIHYTLGWSYEFVAYRVSRRPQHSAKGGSASAERLDADELYRKAEASLRRCLELGRDARPPNAKLIEDAQDLLSSIIREDVP